MLFANLIDGREFRFRGNDTTVYVKVSPTHYRKASAGIHACCLPIAACRFSEFEEVDEVQQSKPFITPMPLLPPS